MTENPTPANNAAIGIALRNAVAKVVFDCVASPEEMGHLETELLNQFNNITDVKIIQLTLNMLVLEIQTADKGRRHVNILITGGYSA